MNENEFTELAGRTLDALELQLEAAGEGVEVERKEGGILEVEFDDGSKLIINRHGAAREIWVAARSGGFHFRWDGAAWRDTRSGTSLDDKLAQLVSDQTGRPFALR